MRAPTVSRTGQQRLALVVAILIATVLASAVAALAAPRPAARAHVLLGAFDVVRPTAVEVTFAKPQPPRRTTLTAVTAPQPVARRAPRTIGSSPLCSGAGWQQRRGAAALGSLRHAVPGGVSIAFLPGRGGLKGMTYYDTHHVDVYVGACDRESDALLRHVVAHELGHAWDSLHLTQTMRADYLAARGIPAGTPWFGCNKCQDFATPAGDFAETYAQWQRGASDSRSKLAPPASQAQLQQLAAAFFS